MNKPPFVNITDGGIAFLTQRPEVHQPGKHDYKKQPVRVAIHRDMTLELHGENFSVSTKLTADDVLGVINMMAYVMREKLCSESPSPTQFVEATR